VFNFNGQMYTKPRKETVSTHHSKQKVLIVWHSRNSLAPSWWNLFR